MLKTRITELFGVRYPLMGAPMGGHSGGVGRRAQGYHAIREEIKRRAHETHAARLPRVARGDGATGVSIISSIASVRRRGSVKP